MIRRKRFSLLPVNLLLLVVICFQISIFAPLETIDLILIDDCQMVMRRIVKEKRRLFLIQNLALMRNFVLE